MNKQEIIKVLRSKAKAYGWVNTLDGDGDYLLLVKSDLINFIIDSPWNEFNAHIGEGDNNLYFN